MSYPKMAGRHPGTKTIDLHKSNLDVTVCCFVATMVLSNK